MLHRREFAPEARPPLTGLRVVDLSRLVAGNMVSKVAELSGLIVATQRKFAGLIEARAKQLEGAA